jgi:hexosaminidase
MSVDAAKEPISLAFHLKTIRKLSSLKMAAYHIHLSDDCGYSLPSKLFSNLTTTATTLFFEDWRLIVATAASYHVELVPEIDFPGHSAWIAARLPALRGPNCTSPMQAWRINEWVANRVVPPSKWWPATTNAIANPWR